MSAELQLQSAAHRSCTTAAPLMEESDHQGSRRTP